MDGAIEVAPQQVEIAAQVRALDGVVEPIDQGLVDGRGAEGAVRVLHTKLLVEASRHAARPNTVGGPTEFQLEHIPFRQGVQLRRRSRRSAAGGAAPAPGARGAPPARWAPWPGPARRARR